MATLTVTSGHLAGEVFEVVSELVIGRVQGDVTIDDSEISRRHAALRPVQGGVEIRDLGSTNGTYVDGRRIDGATTVRDRAELRLGETTMRLVVETAAPPPLAPGPLPPPQGLAPPPHAPAPIAAQAPDAPPPPPEPFRAGASVSTRRASAATRLLIPTILSFGAIVITAIALIVYFATR